MNLKRTLKTQATGSVDIDDLRRLIRTAAGAPFDADVRIWVDAYEGGRNEIEEDNLKFSVEWTERSDG